MAKFAARFSDRKIVQEVLAQITWYHNIALMDKVKTAEEHIWYANATVKNGWSRNVLVHQIESNLYQRQVLADKVTNFEHRLPSPQSELAVQTMKDPYVFDLFLSGKICLNGILSRHWFGIHNRAEEIVLEEIVYR